MQNASLKLLIGAGIGKSTMWWNFQPYGSTFYSGSPHLLLICVFHSNKYLKIHRSSWMSLSDLTSDFGSHHASLEVWGRLFFLCTKCPLPIFQETKILSWVGGHFTTKIAEGIFWRSFSTHVDELVSPLQAKLVKSSKNIFLKQHILLLESSCPFVDCWKKEEKKLLIGWFVTFFTPSNTHCTPK